MEKGGQDEGKRRFELMTEWIRVGRTKASGGADLPPGGTIGVFLAEHQLCSTLCSH